MSKLNCTFCSKVLTSKRNYDNHLLICKSKKDFELELCQNEIKKLKELLLEKEKLLLEKEEQNKILKNIIDSKNQNVSTTIINNNYKPTNSTNTINNNLNISSKIADLEPIDFDEMKTLFENKFGSKYIDNGIAGLATFLCEVPCKNKVLATDFSRKIVAYKTSDKQIIVDPKANILLNTAIKQNADTILDKAEDRYQYWKQQIKDAREEDMEPDETDIKHRDYTKNLKTIATKVKNDVSIISKEATDIILMKGMENKNNIYAIE